MCGIAGIISPKGIEPQHLERMSAKLSHRGPDGCGFMVYADQHGVKVGHNQRVNGSRTERYTVGFVHRRLSVIDLSEASLQPMVDESGTYCLTYNGEIYNYLELRAELEGLEYTFKTTGDTEVLLRAYEAWGTGCLSRLNGMWAFVLLDTRRNRVIISRDRFGIKPLFFTLQNNTLYFASEIKGLLAARDVSCAPNERTVSRFLLTGLTDHTQDSFFRNIFRFPAAHWAAVSLTTPALEIKPEPYWSFPSTRFRGTEREAVDHFRSLFLDAISLHARSDVPVGTCLSGGLDSSSIVCASEVLRRKNQIPNYSHNAFGYCPADEEFSEKPCMKAVADATSIRMHYVDLSQKSFAAALPRILQAQDEPFGSASIAVQWAVFRRARQHGMTVMLDGQGADEMLAGYHYYFNNLAARFLSRLDLIRFLRFRAEYEREIGPYPLSLKATVISLMAPILRRALGVVKSRNLPLISNEQVNDVMSSDLLGHYLAVPLDESRSPASLNHALQRDVESISLPALLRYEDRNSMAQSIEARVPFLDYRLVDFVFTLPEEWKIRGVTTKYILRQAMHGILPEAIRNRKDKLGFKPAPSLTFDHAHQHRAALVENRTEYERRWFKPAGVERMINAADQSVEAEFRLWRIINTKLWVRQFWGGDSKMS